MREFHWNSLLKSRRVHVGTELFQSLPDYELLSESVSKLRITSTARLFVFTGLSRVDYRCSHHSLPHCYYNRLLR